MCEPETKIINREGDQTVTVKLTPPINPNYAATVVRVRRINTLENCDNLVGVPLLGYQAITTKDIEEGALVLVFGAETQLSLAYAAANNLHRHAELNADPEQAGYLEDNRRIKAIKLRGHRSDALILPLSSLSGFYDEWDQLQEGDTFDHLDGREICRKYELRPQGGQQVSQGRRRHEPRVDETFFPKHFDTTNFFRVTRSIERSDYVVITQKLHGTSVRVGHVPVARGLRWWEKVAKRLGVQVVEREWAYVFGSRNVVKDPDNPNAATEFYGTDLYTEIGSQLRGLLPKGYVVYGEIIGWVPGTNTPIQKGYTYRLPEGVAHLYVYRVTTINEDGRVVDLSWPAVREFCEALGLRTVPELTTVYGWVATEQFITENFLDVRLADGWLNALPTDGSKVDEGVCLRAEGITPLVVKAKSPEFLRYETKQLDKGEVDIESAEGVNLEPAAEGVAS